jgi:ribosomal protein S18 acetylase RimI-like enzyme
VRKVGTTLKVEEVHTSSDRVLAAIRELVGQLSASAQPPTLADLDEIISSPACRLLIGRDADGRILGMLTLVLFRIPTGVRAWIEDVVVDGSARGQGLGGLLVREAIAVARRAGARTVDLTSRPDREVANALYVREGFKLRESNLYRIVF